MKTSKKIFIYFSIFISLILIIYPVFSNIYIGYIGNNLSDRFLEEKDGLEDEDLRRKYEWALDFNRKLSLMGNRWDRNFDYEENISLNEMMGVLYIDKLGEKQNVYMGTKGKSLQKGIGYMEGSSLPIGGPSSHSVLTGHSGLYSSKIFTDLDRLEVGDEFSFENVFSRIYYRVKEIRVVEADDYSSLDIIEGKDYMSLLTCTPVYVNTHRLVVLGERIDKK